MQVIRVGTIAMMLALFGASISTAAAQESDRAPRTFENAAEDVQRRLNDAIAELAALRAEITEEKLPLSQQLRDLERQYLEVESAYRDTTRKLDGNLIDLNKLRENVQKRQEDATYLSNLLSEYIRNFEAALPIAELQRYAGVLEQARLAPENTKLSQEEVYQAQIAAIVVSLSRLEEALGGTTFEGSASDGDGLMRQGTFALLGPAALFAADSDGIVGTIQQRVGSLEPSIVAFGSEGDATAASAMIATGQGQFPLDPTLGNAHKVESTSETFIEHVSKGGPVMYPIFAMAGAAILVALYKWIALSLVRKPSPKRVRATFAAVQKHDQAAALREVQGISGPAGRMLKLGVEHLGEPRELIEEVMYEEALKVRLKLQRFLPFIAICAASAPLLGLLGTVTGIINTFKLITIFGSGDVKMLSGGISEALITTEFGLIVAIPSLLLHAFLSRKARGIVSQMETLGVSFVNQVSKSPFGRQAATEQLRELEPVNPQAQPQSAPPDMSNQLREALASLLTSTAAAESRNSHEKQTVGAQAGA